MLRYTHAFAPVCCTLLLLAAPAHAGDWDIQVSRLCMLKTRSGQRLDCGGGYTKGMADADPVILILPDNAAFRSLMSELGAVFAPNILAAADTEGFGGFSFAFQFGMTQINPKRLSKDPVLDETGEGLPFWRAAKSVSGGAWGTGNIRDSAEHIRRLDRELPGAFAPTVSVFIRKGIWMPLPSFEFGVGFRHLLGSKMWGPAATAKLALHEGFQGWPVPALAVRGTGTRVVGSPDFNLTVVGIDGSISKHFGVADSFNITPYTGYQFLIVVGDSEMVDATPIINPYEKTANEFKTDPTMWNTCRVDDCYGNFAFADLSNIYRHRFFIGFRANMAFATFMAEYTYFAPGNTTDELYTVGFDGKATKLLTIPDSAGAQHSFEFSVGLDF